MPNNSEFRFSDIDRLAIGVCLEHVIYVNKSPPDIFALRGGNSKRLLYEISGSAHRHFSTATTFRVGGIMTSSECYRTGGFGIQ